MKMGHHRVGPIYSSKVKSVFITGKIDCLQRLCESDPVAGISEALQGSSLNAPAYPTNVQRPSFELWKTNRKLAGMSQSERKEKERIADEQREKEDRENERRENEKRERETRRRAENVSREIERKRPGQFYDPLDRHRRPRRD